MPSPGERPFSKVDQCMIKSPLNIDWSRFACVNQQAAISPRSYANSGFWLTVLMSIVLLLSISSAPAQDVVFIPNDYTFRLVVSQPKDFPSSRLDLGSVCRVAISYRQTNTSPPGPEILYKDLWFSNGRPIGCHYYNPLMFDSISPLLGMVVEVQEADDRVVENATYRAASLANALTKLSLELYLNKTPANRVSVPEILVDSLEQQLTSLGYVSPSQRDGLLALELFPNPSGRTRSVIYPI